MAKCTVGLLVHVDILHSDWSLLYRSWYHDGNVWHHYQSMVRYHNIPNLPGNTSDWNELLFLFLTPFWSFTSCLEELLQSPLRGLRREHYISRQVGNFASTRDPFPPHGPARGGSSGGVLALSPAQHGLCRKVSSPEMCRRADAIGQIPQKKGLRSFHHKEA